MIVCGFSVDVWCLVCCQPLLACSLLAVCVSGGSNKIQNSEFITFVGS